MILALAFCLPVLVDMDVRSDIGSIREMIGDYIVNVKGGAITPEIDNNWKITGNDWDPGLHQKAVELVKAGKITIPTSAEGWMLIEKAITEDDLK